MSMKLIFGPAEKGRWHHAQIKLNNNQKKQLEYSATLQKHIDHRFSFDEHEVYVKLLVNQKWYRFLK